jgi:hypothetical protein
LTHSKGFSVVRSLRHQASGTWLKRARTAECKAVNFTTFSAPKKDAPLVEVSSEPAGDGRRFAYRDFSYQDLDGWFRDFFNGGWGIARLVAWSLHACFTSFVL